MASGHLVGHLRASMVAFNRSNDEFCASPTRDAVPTVPLPVGKRRHDMCVVATVPTEARFGPRDIVVPEVGVEDIVVGALLKDMPKNHTH